MRQPSIRIPTSTPAAASATGKTRQHVRRRYLASAHTCHTPTSSSSWAAHAQLLAPDVSPPAKNTRPDGNDAPAKLPRASPRPLGNEVQLLLVALYMSTKEETPLPPVKHASAQHPHPHKHSRSSISNRQNTAARPSPISRQRTHMPHTNKQQQLGSTRAASLT
jgi:hypothetical protein